MMRKGLLLLSVLFAVSCGGGERSGMGGTEKGFYSLELRLSTVEVQSPAVSLSRRSSGQVEITLPSDTISGKLSFRYSGTQTTPLSAFIQSAKLCVLDNCYSFPITGILNANSERDFSFQFFEHKRWLPWIAVNPYEDRVLNSQGKVSVQLNGASGNQIVYNLPPSEQIGTYLYRVYGREIEVYQGDTKLCDNQGFSSSCTIQVENTKVLITFPGSVPSDLTLEYSVEDIVDINPSVDARQYNGLYNGTPTPTVQGCVEVKVRLQSGETITARAPIIFKVRGQ